MDGIKPVNVDNWLNGEAVPSKSNVSDTVANAGKLLAALILFANQWRGCEYDY